MTDIKSDKDDRALLAELDALKAEAGMEDEEDAKEVYVASLHPQQLAALKDAYKHKQLMQEALVKAGHLCKAVLSHYCMLNNSNNQIAGYLL